MRDLVAHGSMRYVEGVAHSLLKEGEAFRGVRVEEGVFRAMMDVRLVNRGPVTLLLDSTRAI